MHVWIWWVVESFDLFFDHHRILQEHAALGNAWFIGVSIISCWEVAMPVSKKRLALSMPTLDWIQLALNLSNVRLLELMSWIAVVSTELSSELHSDPADRILVATAREAGLTLLT